MSAQTASPWADLNGRTFGVTGGGGHLGAEIALALARAGGIVVIAGRDRDRLDRVVSRAGSTQTPGKILPVVADMREASDVRGVLDRIEIEGPLYGWVNSAYEGSTGSLAAATAGEISKTLESALGSLILVTKEVAARMTDPGSIVNLSSMYGLVAPQPSLYASHPAMYSSPAYGAAKAGVAQFTRHAACELASSGIRVNCVSPGPFPREMDDGDDFLIQLARRVPLGRVGRPSEICGPILFLLSSWSSFVTGHNLIVDGGWTAW